MFQRACKPGAAPRACATPPCCQPCCNDAVPRLRCAVSAPLLKLAAALVACAGHFGVIWDNDSNAEGEGAVAKMVKKAWHTQSPLDGIFTLGGVASCVDSEGPMPVWVIAA
jgi:hypothetical protein